MESKYYLQLKYSTVDFKYHESFEILPKFKVGKETYSRRVYTPDFTIYEDEKLIKVIDCKGGKATVTDASRLRMVMFMQRYQVPVVIATYDSKTKTFEEKVK